MTQAKEDRRASYNSDLNSMILSGRNRRLESQQPMSQEYTQKVKQIKALRRFQQIFRKQCLYRQRKQSVNSYRKKSPHQLNNRLKGMFFLRKRIELYERVTKQAIGEEEYPQLQPTPPLCGTTLSPTKINRLSETKPLNFVNHIKTSSGKVLHRTIVPKRPKSRLEESNFVFRSYNRQDFINLVLLANKVKVVHSPSPSFIYFNAYVEEGNNSEMIKNAIRKHNGWRVVETAAIANIVWSQFYKPGLDLKLRKKLREIQFDRSQSGASKNLCSTLPAFQDFKLVKKGSESTKSNQASNKILSKQQYTKQVQKICPFQEHLSREPTVQILIGPSLYFYNHIPNHRSISDKKHLLANMTKYYESRGWNIFETMPFSIQINNKISTAELKLKIGAHDGMWIIKPGQNSNRGRGIVVCRNTEDAIGQINARFKNNTEGNEVAEQSVIGQQKRLNKQYSHSLIIQRYIEPMLYCRRKFDIRMFMLVTLVKGKMRGYLYEEGYIRTCSKYFSAENFNKFIHLTNDAIQCRSSDYGKFEEGNKVSWRKFKSWLVEEDKSSFHINFEAQTKQICQNILHSVKQNFSKKPQRYNRRSTYKSMNVSQTQEELDLAPHEQKLQQNNKIYFQVFGLDFLIDKNEKVWLIEANTNPALTTDCSRVVSTLIPKMIDNALAIAVEPFTRVNKPQNSRVQNRFTAIFDDEWYNA